MGALDSAAVSYTIVPVALWFAAQCARGRIIMKKNILGVGTLVGAALFAVVATANGASANTIPTVSTSGVAPEVIVYTLTNAGLSDGGLLSGTITVDNWGGGNAGLASWNLSTSGGTQPAETYNPGNGFANGIPSGPWPDVKGWDFYHGSYAYGLQLAFSGDLLTGADVALLVGIGGPSFEIYNGYISANFTVASGIARYVTPLPSSWFLLFSGFVGFGFLAYRRNGKAATALPA
jgi:hypothetical protein